VLLHRAGHRVDWFAWFIFSQAAVQVVRLH
jgi:hypothetical protein